jgi:hypothetical protein
MRNVDIVISACAMASRTVTIASKLLPPHHSGGFPLFYRLTSVVNGLKLSGPS